MGVSAQNRARILAAWVCLLAAVALYAPLGAAAWWAHGMACCTGDHCPIKGHHHPQKHAAEHAAEHKDKDMDCGHDMGEMVSCSMSCCDNTEKPVVAAVAFVLPDLALTFGSTAVTGMVENLQSIEIPRSLQPVYPPPRFAQTS